MKSIVEHEGMRITIEEIDPTPKAMMEVPELLVLIDQAVRGFGYLVDGDLEYTDHEEGDDDYNEPWKGGSNGDFPFDNN